MSLWNKEKDQHTDVNPCTQLIWARIKHGKLEFHVHAHSSDAYKKLLMNLQEFIALQLYVAERLNIQPGTYHHIIDSCHIHTREKEHVQALLPQLI